MRWEALLGSMRDLLAPPWSEAVLLATSLVCGAAVGIERERQRKPAGLRTLLLICVGSTIFTMVSMTRALGAAEPGRIAAQIVTGVGFLGAGAIIRGRSGVTGLTTAATVWTTSAVGIVVGAGYAVAGLALSLTIVATLSTLKRAEELLLGPCRKLPVRIGYRRQGGKTRVQLQRLFDRSSGPAEVIDERATEDGSAELTLLSCDRHREHRATLAAVAELEAVRTIETTAAPS